MTIEETELRKSLAGMDDVSGVEVYAGSHVWYYDQDSKRLVDGYVRGVLAAHNEGPDLAEIVPADKQDEKNPTLLVLPGWSFKRQ